MPLMPPTLFPATKDNAFLISTRKGDQPNYHREQKKERNQANPEKTC